MRPCPNCEKSDRIQLVEFYDSKEWSLFRCSECGMLYADSKSATEQTVNNYYLTSYQSNDGEPAIARLDSLAVFIREFCLPPMMDIGGTDMELAKRVPMDVSGAGDVFTKQYATFILSHTLEHVYNVPGMLEKVKNNILPGGQVVVEVPIWKGNEDFLKYDKHVQHINKYTPNKLEGLFEKHGFLIIYSGYLPRYIEYDTWRLLARNA